MNSILNNPFDEYEKYQRNMDKSTIRSNTPSGKMFNQLTQRQTEQQYQVDSANLCWPQPSSSSEVTIGDLIPPTSAYVYLLTYQKTI